MLRFNFTIGTPVTKYSVWTYENAQTLDGLHLWKKQKNAMYSVAIVMLKRVTHLAHYKSGGLRGCRTLIPFGTWPLTKRVYHSTMSPVKSVWWPRRESNPYATRTQVPKTCASTISPRGRLLVGMEGLEPTCREDITPLM